MSPGWNIGCLNRMRALESEQGMVPETWEAFMPQLYDGCSATTARRLSPPPCPAQDPRIGSSSSAAGRRRGSCGRGRRAGPEIAPDASTGVDGNRHSAVDFLAVPHAEDEDNQAIALDLANEPVIAHAAFPKFAEPQTLQRLTDAARILEPRYSFVEEFQDAPGVLGVELFQFALRRGRKLNLPGHDAS